MTIGKLRPAALLAFAPALHATHTLPHPGSSHFSAEPYCAKSGVAPALRP